MRSVGEIHLRRAIPNTACSAHFPPDMFSRDPKLNSLGPKYRAELKPEQSPV